MKREKCRAIHEGGGTKTTSREKEKRRYDENADDGKKL